MNDFNGSTVKQVGPQITLASISPEASDLLDTIMAEWEIHEAGLKASFPDHEPSHYAFAYWLVRWSGLVKPSG
jgi:hypothetical protein